MPRMRTAEKVLEIIKDEDPDTEVTLHYIRALIATGRVKHTPVGRKKLVDADAVIAYIAAGGQTNAQAETEILPQDMRECRVRKVTA